MRVAGLVGAMLVVLFVLGVPGMVPTGVLAGVRATLCRSPCVAPVSGKTVSLRAVPAPAPRPLCCDDGGADGACCPGPCCAAGQIGWVPLALPALATPRQAAVRPAPPNTEAVWSGIGWEPALPPPRHAA